LLFVAASAVVLNVGCKKKDPPGDGFLLITVVSEDVTGTPLEGLRSITASGTRVDVVHRVDCDAPETESVRTVVDTAQTVQLISDAENVPRFVTRFPVPAGCVEQVRLITQGVELLLDGDRIAGRVPSGPHTGIKVVPEDDGPAFPIREGETTAIRIEYDPNDRLVINRGQGVLQKPVLEAEQVASEFALGVVTDEVVLTFKESTSDDRIRDIVRRGDASIIRRYPRNYVTVRIKPDADLRDKIVFFAKRDAVIASLPNTLVDNQGPNPFAGGTPDDPLFADMPPDGFESLNFDAIHAPAAWEVTTGSATVKLGVVDAGFDFLQRDLLPNWWINEDELPDSVRSALVDDGDGVITFEDLNAPENDGVCPKENSPPTDVCDPRDLVNGDCPGGRCRAGYGFQDGVDNDDNGFIDDVVGWDFGGQDNLNEICTSCGSPEHGTGVAGLAAGRGNNGAAFSGVAWRARIMPAGGLLVANPPGAGLGAPVVDRLLRDSVVRAVRYLHENGAQVVVMSQSSVIRRSDTIDPACEGKDKGVHRVPPDKFDRGIQEFADEWEDQVGRFQEDAVMVVSADNCGSENDDAEGVFLWPAFTTPRPDIGVDFVHETMITVASTQHFDELTGEPSSVPSFSTFSSFGPETILMAAPGEGWRWLDVQVPPAGLHASVTDCGDGFKRCQGTSLVTPLVGGAADLVFANHPGLTALEVKQRLVDTAAPLPPVRNGLLDVEAAVGP